MVSLLPTLLAICYNGIVPTYRIAHWLCQSPEAKKRFKTRRLTKLTRMPEESNEFSPFLHTAILRRILYFCFPIFYFTC
jgi:hypothetical protein